MKRILLSLIILLFGMTAVSYAAYTNVAADTTITSYGTGVTLSYKVGGSPTRNVNSAVDASAVVSKNGGIKQTGATWTDLPATNNINAGDGYSYTFSIINSGNFTESVAAAVVNKAGGFAGTWLSALSGASIAISREGVSTGITLYVTADAAADDGDEGTLSVSLNGTTAGAFYKEYTGANAYTYGASGNVETPLAFKAKNAKIYVTKNVTVSAPSDYVTKGGGATDPVPGATLVYAMDYLNSGGATGNSVEIVDTIPANTEFASATGGTSRQYSDDNGATWTYVPGGTVDPAVTNVKWIIGNVGPNGAGTVTLNAVIK